ncbi:MAG: NACHT domain-containing protein [Colwellia sp.]
MKTDISLLLQKDESPILEFKRQWYWGGTPVAAEMSDKWGELIKDIISLANGYLGYVGQFRHLIFGYAEDESKLYNVDIKSIKHLKDLRRFKKSLLQKLEKQVKPSLLQISIEEVEVDGTILLVFEIACPINLTELKQSLKTKTRHLDEGAILVRKGQKTDEIRTATPDEILGLKKEFEEYEGSELFLRMNPKEDEPKQERSIEKTIQSFIDKNTSLSLADNYPKKVKNWKEGIIYEAYKLVDSFGGTKEFVYIHDLANQGKTLEDIKKTASISTLSSAIVLIDRPNTIDVKKRKANISKLFKSKHVYFIDEFGFQFLYKECILPFEKFNLPVYVDGLYDDKEVKDCSALDRLVTWFKSENEPLFVVSGHGGIGKTTLAKQFLDHVYDASDEPGILFIDSKEIIHELSRKFSHTNKINDVYDFYTALMDSGSSGISKFNKELLKLSIDNGSLIVVLDGIDEVIAKLGEKFDVDSFITSIFEEYSSELHKTKILITCRDHFWNDVGKKILLPEITLKAFNHILAKDFFTQKLVNDPKKISKAMVIAKELAIEEHSETKNIDALSQTYIPFLLDMIGYLIKTQSDNFDHSDLFQSRYLNNQNHTDILVGQICKREILKLESLSLDNQIQLFMRIASQKEGRISMYDIKSELLNIVNDVDDSVIEKIKGHPLIEFTDNHIYFRYDVFETYFKSILAVDLFKSGSVDNLDSNCADIISGYLRYDSSFIDAVTSKVELSDDLLIFCIELIDTAKRLEGINHESFVSSIVCFLLNLSKKDQTKPYDLASRTELIETLFLDGSEIKDLCLVDIFGSTNSKPTFDFKGKTLSNCHFHNYEYFWECSIDEETRFKKSYFKDIDPREGINYIIPKNMFTKSCDITLIEHLLNKNTEEIKNTIDMVKKDLLKVFKLFYQRNNFYPRKQEEVRKKLTAVHLLPTLISKNVIVNFKDPKKPTMKQYKVHNDYKSVVEYFEQGTPSAELKVLIQELANRLTGQSR